MCTFHRFWNERRDISSRAFRREGKRAKLEAARKFEALHRICGAFRDVRARDFYVFPLRQPQGAVIAKFKRKFQRRLA